MGREKICRKLESEERCVGSAMMPDEEKSKYVDFFQGFPQGYTSSSSLLKILINDTIEAARQGIMVGGTIVSRLMFADDSVGMSESPKGLQRQIDEALKRDQK